MPGFTPNYNLQYPSPGDTITRPDVLGLQALAEDVDASLTTLEAYVESVRIPAAAQVLATAQNILNNTITSFRYSTETFDTVGDLADVVTFPTSPIRIQENGTYFFTCRVSVPSSTGLRHMEVLRNNVDILSRQAWQPSTAGLSCNLSSLATFTAGDWLNARLRHTQGATITLQGSDLMVVRVGS